MVLQTFNLSVISYAKRFAGVCLHPCRILCLIDFCVA